MILTPADPNRAQVLCLSVGVFEVTTRNANGIDWKSNFAMLLSVLLSSSANNVQTYDIYKTRRRNIMIKYVFVNQI